MRDGEHCHEAHSTPRGRGFFAFSLRTLLITVTVAAVVLGIAAWVNRVTVLRWTGVFTLHMETSSTANQAVKSVGSLPIWGGAADNLYLEMYLKEPPPDAHFRSCDSQSGRFLASIPCGGSKNLFGHDLTYDQPNCCLLRIEYADGDRHFQIVDVPNRRRTDVTIRVQIP